MPNKYAAMDNWSEEEVALFKELAIAQSEGEPNITAGPMATASSTQSHLKIVAEGDSWFDYKISADLIDCLRKFHGYKIKNYAKLGDTLENMIYGTQVDRDYNRSTPQINIVLRRVEQVQPDVFLFSGGGNDIAGNEFPSFLHHSEANLGVLKTDFAESTINVTFRKYYLDLIQKVLAKSPNTHIFTHGYGYARPTGKGVGILGIDFVGPWLLPSLGMKGIDNNEGKKAIETLINLYNDMLKELDTENPNFHHIDLRHLLSDDDWRDELHLKSSAYRLASDSIAASISSVYT